MYCPKCKSNEITVIKYNCFRCNEKLMVCKFCIGFRFCKREGNCN